MLAKLQLISCDANGFSKFTNLCGTRRISWKLEAYKMITNRHFAKTFLRHGLIEIYRNICSVAKNKNTTSRNRISGLSPHLPVDLEWNDYFCRHRISPCVPFKSRCSTEGFFPRSSKNCNSSLYPSRILSRTTCPRKEFERLTKLYLISSHFGTRNLSPPPRALSPSLKSYMQPPRSDGQVIIFRKKNLNEIILEESRILWQTRQTRRKCDELYFE